MDEQEVERIDSYDIRQKILNISHVDRKKSGFSKGRMRYMKRNIKFDKPFTLNSHVLERVNKWEALFQDKSKNVYVFTCNIQNVNFTGKIVEQLEEML